MTSPFPGMDPYLEAPALWADFHTRFITYLAEAITELLPPDYVAAIGEHVSLLGPGSDDQDVIPDVTVVAPTPVPIGPRGRQAHAAAVVDVELRPATLRNRRVTDPEVQVYIEVLRLPDQQPVTVVEVLSPKNKRGGGRGVYIDKRNAVLDTSVNLVELDLLRGGRRIDLQEPLPPGDYFALVSRGDRRPLCDVYAWTIRHRLPALPVPLRPADGEVRVDLAAPFAETYRRGRFHQRARYADPPPSPAFQAADVGWMAGPLKHTEPT